MVWSLYLAVLVVLLLVTITPISSLPPHNHTRQKPGNVGGIGVWSGDKGWGLQVHTHSYHSFHSHRCKGGEEGVEMAREGWMDEEGEEGMADTSPRTPKVHQPGITLTVLNQRTTQPIFRKVFPLRVYWAHWADLDWHLQHIAPGRIVVIAVAVSGIFGLRHATLRLAALGSLFARHLPPSAHWTWVFVKGGRTISETALTHAHLPHHAHTLLPLSHLPDQRTTSSRWQYCGAHAVMGGLCDEVAPDPLPTPTPPPIANQTHLAKVPIIVTAGNRYQYLYHTLTTLLAAPGAIHHNVLVVLGDAPPSTTLLLRLLNLNFSTLPVHGHHNDKLFRYYRSVFNLVATTFPDAPAAIFLDEDVEVSPDFFSYFSQTLWLLNEDPTLYCINAHSATGFRGIAHDPGTVLRARVQVSWGFALSLKFVREVVNVWPEDLHQTDTIFYDEWVYRHGSRGRECVFPEVSRTRHYGMGINTDAWSTEQWFLTQPLVAHPHVPLVNVSGLMWATWQNNFSSNLRRATPLINNPCSSTFVPPVNTTSYFVLFYSQKRKKDGNPDYKHFFYAAKCLNAWGVSEQGLHEGVLTVRTSLLTTVYLVGTPYSTYGHLRPHHIRPWSYDMLSDSEENQVVERIRQLEIGEYHVANINITSESLIDLLSHTS